MADVCKARFRVKVVNNSGDYYRITLARLFHSSSTRIAYDYQDETWKPNLRENPVITSQQYIFVKHVRIFL